MRACALIDRPLLEPQSNSALKQERRADLENTAAPIDFVVSIKKILNPEKHLSPLQDGEEADPWQGAITIDINDIVAAQLVVIIRVLKLLTDRTKLNQEIHQ